MGFFSWLAFAYIGIRARHPLWTLWSLFYAAPLVVFAVVTSNMPQSWSNVTVYATMLLYPVAIVHAFLVRKEYLLRLDLIKRETSSVSFTSRGRGWEWSHSLWMAWTLTLGIFGWVAFLYIAFRARRVRWLLWGLVYFAAFAVYAVRSGRAVYRGHSYCRGDCLRGPRLRGSRRLPGEPGEADARTLRGRREDATSSRSGG